MHSDELRKMRDAYYDEDSDGWKIINELITRSDLQTEAIVALAGDDKIEAVENLVDHVAPPKKKKYTVDDIKRGVYVSFGKEQHYIYCGEYGYTSGGWVKQVRDGTLFCEEVASVIYAGLVATNNLPEEYR